MDRILVTGGAGFIGTNLINRMLEGSDLRIRVLDNLSNPSGALQEGERVQVVVGDILDADAVRAAVEGVDAVIHLAAHTRVVESMEDPVFNLRVNVLGTINVLEAMREAGVSRILSASTGGAIVGDVPPPVHENLVPRPAAPYGASKLAVEGYLSAYAQSFGLAPLSLRFSNIYGTHSRNKGSVVAHFIKAITSEGRIIIYGDGTQTRDFLYVSDLCDGIIAALDSNTTGVMQLGSGKPTSVNELVELMRGILPLPFEIVHEDSRAGEVMHTHCDITRAATCIGFRPETGLVEGIQLTWDWFKEEMEASSS